MKNEYLNEFKDLLVLVHETYRKPLPKGAVKLWWGLFSAYEFDAVTRAFKAHLSHREKGVFLPTPADILAHLPIPWREDPVFAGCVDPDDPDPYRHVPRRPFLGGQARIERELSRLMDECSGGGA